MSDVCNMADGVYVDGKKIPLKGNVNNMTIRNGKVIVDGNVVAEGDKVEADNVLGFIGKQTTYKKK